MARLKTILCIDDHWNGLIGRKMFLENNGYEVLQASGGDEGLKLFQSHAVDAVVLDYQMPGMKGDVVAKKMKRDQVPCSYYAVIRLRTAAAKKDGGGGHIPLKIPTASDSFIHASGFAQPSTQTVL